MALSPRRCRGTLNEVGRRREDNRGDVGGTVTRHRELLDVRCRMRRGKCDGKVPLSLELASSNIQINAVAPNYIENPTYFPPELTQNEAAMAKCSRIIRRNVWVDRKKWPSGLLSLHPINAVMLRVIWCRSQVVGPDRPVRPRNLEIPIF